LAEGAALRGRPQSHLRTDCGSPTRLAAAGSAFPDQRPG
jgi:hypothetical protein